MRSGARGGRPLQIVIGVLVLGVLAHGLHAVTGVASDALFSDWIYNLLMWGGVALCAVRPLTVHPDGLGGEDIPVGARIIAVCDSYDAITSKRSYADAQSHEEALAELRRCAGTQFDPVAVKAFCAANPVMPSVVPVVSA